jgi:hypothetical protein
MFSDKSMAVSPARCSADQLRFQSEVGVLTPCTQIVASPTLSASATIQDTRGDVPDGTKSLRTCEERPGKHEWSFRCIFPINEGLSSLVVLNESAGWPSKETSAYEEHSVNIVDISVLPAPVE